jgi:hypothetical protein
MPVFPNVSSDESARALVENQLFEKYKAAIVNGQTRTSVYNSTIGSDLGIRKTDSLAISRAAEIDANTILSLRALPDGSPIQPSNMLEMNTPGEHAYSYTVSVDMMTVDGEHLEEQYLPIYSDAILSKEDVLNMANDMKSTQGGTDVDITAYEVVEAHKNTA